jgi:formate C-acetyltransferase
MQLIRVWSSQRHAPIQFNILNKQTLREAQKNPEKYRDLVVRIAGYCAYFVDLSPAVQAEIIARTEQQMVKTLAVDEAPAGASLQPA